tara:strand:- start:292 stop:687 length:396 start_codon:yes stop_codon:yes gene_type:complete
MIKLRELIEVDSDDTAGILIMHENKYLLCLRTGDGYWSIPKGHIHYNEEPIEGAIRELSEETQIFLNGTPKFLQKYEKDNSGHFHVFEFKTQKRFVPRLNFEHITWGYFGLKELPQPLDKYLIDIFRNENK